MPIIIIIVTPRQNDAPRALKKMFRTTQHQDVRIHVAMDDKVTN